MGVSGDTSNPDLDALVAGGDAFLKRIAELNDAKKSYEQAYENLKLGNSAVEAHADAKAKQYAAETALNEARTNADAMMADAQNKADQIIKEATAAAAKAQTDARYKSESDLADLQSQIDAAKLATEEWVKNAKSDLDTRLADAKYLQAEAKELKNMLEAELAAAKAETAKAVQAQKDAAAVKAESEATTARLKAALSGG